MRTPMATDETSPIPGATFTDHESRNLDRGIVPVTLQQRRMGFFNLPSDQMFGYPKFTSFQQRKDYIRAQILESQEVNDRVRQLASMTTCVTIGHPGKEVIEDYSTHHPGLELIDVNARGTGPGQHAQCTQDKSESTLLHDISPTNMHVRDPKMESQHLPDQLHQVRKEFGPAVKPNPFPAKSDCACGTGSQSVEQTSLIQKGNSYLSSICAWSNPPHKSPVVWGYRFPGEDQAPAGDLLNPQSHIPFPLASKSESHFLDQLRQLEIAFVGDKTARFLPIEGDLIVRKPGLSMRFGSTGYIITYKGPSTHRFEHGELVLRVRGSTYTEAGVSVSTTEPSTWNLELYRYNMDGKWTYLGSQVETKSERNDIVMNSNTSPVGKYMKVGGRVIPVGKFTPLIPRKGDVIIRRDAWQENFRHEENFWHSMVKWHGDQQIIWAPQDLLLRLFVESQKHIRLSTNSSKKDSVPEPGDHNECLVHGSCLISHGPPFPGYAELYEIPLTDKETNSDHEWIYEGRAGQICNSDSWIKNVDPFLILYANN